MMLIGDAAGLINSLNGEGIQYALLSGRWAAEVALTCAAADDFSVCALASYGRRVEDELRYDMALSSAIVQFIRNRNLNPLWMQALRVIVARARVDPDYADITGGVLAGMVPASSVMSAKVIGGTARQAAMSLGVGAVRQAIRGPSAAETGMEAALAAIAMANESARHPLDFTRWGFGVAGEMLELATQVVRHAVGNAKPNADDEHSW